MLKWLALVCVVVIVLSVFIFRAVDQSLSVDVPQTAIQAVPAVPKKIDRESPQSAGLSHAQERLSNRVPSEKIAPIDGDILPQ